MVMAGEADGEDLGDAGTKQQADVEAPVYRERDAEEEIEQWDHWGHPIFFEGASTRPTAEQCRVFSTVLFPILVAIVLSLGAGTIS